MGQQMSSPYLASGMCSIDNTTLTPIPAPATSFCSLMQAVPAPKGLTCGFLGYLSRPDLVADWAIPSSDLTPQTTCIKACWESDSCGSLSYDYDTRQCALYATSIQSQKPRKSKAGARFYEPGCFYDHCEINEPLGKNASRSELDSPLASFKLKHCGLEEMSWLTDPEKDYEDHVYFPVNLPFQAQLYGSTTDSLYMSINGYISFGSPFITRPEPHALPHYTQMAKGKAFDMMPSVEGGLPEYSLCALWTEQEILNTMTSTSSLATPHPPGRLLGQQSMGQSYGSRPRAIKRDSPDSELSTHSLAAEHGETLKHQGMRYTVTGEEGHRQVIFTWNTSKKHDSTTVHDYDILYREDKPGVWMVRYRVVGDSGKIATIGAQGNQGNVRFVQYTDENLPVADGMTLLFDSNANTFRRIRHTKSAKPDPKEPSELSEL